MEDDRGANDPRARNLLRHAGDGPRLRREGKYHNYDIKANFMSTRLAWVHAERRRASAGHMASACRHAAKMFASRSRRCVQYCPGFFSSKCSLRSGLRPSSVLLCSTSPSYASRAFRVNKHRNVAICAFVSRCGDAISSHVVACTVDECTHRDSWFVRAAVVFVLLSTTTVDVL